jgi:hypothetical protein
MGSAKSSTSQHPASGTKVRRLSLEMDAFGWSELELQSRQLGVSESELVRFAVMYYLADVDSGRVARTLVDGPPTPGDP